MATAVTTAKPESKDERSEKVMGLFPFIGKGFSKVPFYNGLPFIGEMVQNRTATRWAFTWASFV
jgi:hypothetical protein